MHAQGQLTEDLDGHSINHFGSMSAKPPNPAPRTGHRTYIQPTNSLATPFLCLKIHIITFHGPRTCKDELRLDAESSRHQEEAPKSTL
jgi:hypothetical protein